MNRLADWAFRTVGSSRPVALMRIGLAFLLWSRWADEVAPHYAPNLLRPPLAAAFIIATVLMAVGLWTRLAVAATAAVTFAMYFYGALRPAQSSWAGHHSYLLAAVVLLCVFTPCERSFSVDRWLAVRRARRSGAALPPESGNLFGQRLIAIQLSLVYFWGAVEKSHWGYLNGARMEQILMHVYFGSKYPEWPGFHEICVAAGIGTVLLEYALAFGLFFPRPRRWLLPLGALFHVMLYFTVPVSTFSATVILLYLAYLDPDEVHRRIDEVMAPATPAPP